jgi:hypothetical protein
MGAGAPLTGTTEPAAIFHWIGSMNSYWFACATPGGAGYILYKMMTGSTLPMLAGCNAVELAALDYTGPSPAAWEYV